MLQIRHFSLNSGVKPFETWLSSLDTRSKAKVRAYVDRVALGGSKKNIRSLGDGLNEIKIDFGPGLRVYYGVIDNELMLLLGGGNKNSQSRDIEKIYDFWRQAMHRHESYDKELAAELQDQEFAKDFILDLIEGDEGLSPLEALRHTIRRIGVKEFSKTAKIPYESVCRMLESDGMPKIATLDRYFAFFGLKLKIILEDVA